VYRYLGVSGVSGVSGVRQTSGDDTDSKEEIKKEKGENLKKK
jgi:hypothetical protein